MPWEGGWYIILSVGLWSLGKPTHINIYMWYDWEGQTLEQWIVYGSYKQSDDTQIKMISDGRGMIENRVEIHILSAKMM